MTKIRIVHISDTHLFHLSPDWKDYRPPPGDILIHSGDLTFDGSVMEIQDALKWVGGLPYKDIVLIAGNHDHLFQKDPMLARSMVPKKVTYLENSEHLNIQGLRIWGSPWTRRFEKWAFQIDTNEQARAMWSLIPRQVDIVVTHGPPKNIFDKTFWTQENVGCPMLARAVERRDILLHCFGHIHSEHGAKKIGYTWYSNGVLLDEAYHPTHKPNLFDVDPVARTCEQVL